MRYLFLAYRSGPTPELSSAGEASAFGEACRTSDAALRESGYVLAAVRLQDGRAAATVWVQNGEVSLTEGPSGETAEQLSALYLIDARDLNEAVRIASKMPQAQRGPIEVRSMAEFDWGAVRAQNKKGRDSHE
jgi:hypothetical protein